MAGEGIKSMFSDVDEYGFERQEDFDYESYENFMSTYIKILTKRSKKWTELLSNQKTLKKDSKLKRYIRKGIPPEHRGFVWTFVSKADEIKANMAQDFYKILLKQDCSPNVVEAIKLDLHRTFPNNIFFKSSEHYQNKLFNILVAYAHHNPKVSYCQGLNYIAGLLLIVTKNEETTFWLLKVLIEQILEDYYSNTMEGLIVDIEVLSELIRIKVPEVYQHINNIGLPWPVICTKWFICLFVEVLPIETVLRIWDCLFNEGSKIFFRVAITLMKLNKRYLLSSKDSTEAANRFKIITKNTAAINCHTFMNNVFKMSGSLSNSTILKLRQKITNEKKLSAIKKSK